MIIKWVLKLRSINIFLHVNLRAFISQSVGNEGICWWILQGRVSQPQHYGHFGSELCFFGFFLLLLFVFFLMATQGIWHMKVPRLGAEWELQLLACAAATATPDLSPICDPHCCSHQCQILKPPSKARDQTCILTDTSRVRYYWATMGTPSEFFIVEPVLCVLGCLIASLASRWPSRCQ